MDAKTHSTEPTTHSVWKRPGDESSANKRRHGRVVCRDVGCTLGEVLDLSASGLRVRGKGRPAVCVGDRFSLSIQTLDGPMLAPVQVAWVKRSGFRKHEIGITFGETGPALVRALAALARASANNEVITPWFKSDHAA